MIHTSSIPNDSRRSPRQIIPMCMHNHWVQISLLLLIFLLLVSHEVVAKEPRFGIRGNPTGWGGSCEPQRYKVLAGVLFFVDVCNRADQPKETRQPGWPKGYALEAALDVPNKAPFVPTPGLIERLQPTPYLGTATRSQLRRLDSGDLEYVDIGWLNLKQFTLRMPSDLAGHTITLRARCDKGGAVCYTVPLHPFEVISPCDRSDTARIVASEIYLAAEQDDLDRVVQIADSMLAVGLSDAVAWKWAKGIYLRRGQIDKAIACLDRLFEDYGVTDFLDIGGNMRLNYEGPRNPHQQELYEQERAGLLELKNQQQQH